MLRGQRARRGAAGVVQGGDLIPDGRLKRGDVDRLENTAIATTVADVALSVAPPTNIALFGPWGSGKSSVYSMIEERIRSRDGRARVVRYDAWKYGGRDLKRNFISSVARDLEVEDAEFDGELTSGGEHAKLRLGPWVWENRGSLGLGLLLAVVLAAFWIVVLAGAQTLLKDVAFRSAAGGLVSASGTVFGLALAALIVGPKVLEGAVTKRVTPAPSGDDEFTTRFGKLIDKAEIGVDGRLVVFVDELDRCAPDDVVATLVDLKTFLEAPRCVFIVAVDRAVIEDALGKVPQAKPVRGDEPYYATRGAFLDKIFQHQIALPPLRPRTLTLFARELVDEQAGLWQELRQHDSDLYELVVFALVPVHIRSPRRVKVLLNAYATNVRTAEARGIAWPDRAAEIAVLTVLQTEFPEVAADLLRVPRLLAFLRGDEQSDAPEVRRIVQRYKADPAKPLPAADPAGEEYEIGELANPAGDLLSDTGDESEVSAAKQTTYTQLFQYLTKIASASIPDPRPDLLYLQAAGRRDGLGDPTLGDVIDFATDTAPDTVVQAFTNQSSDVVRIAVPLLVVEGEQTFGPGRFFAYESACRLAETLDWHDVCAIARDLAPRILPSRTDRRWPLQAVPGALRLASAAEQTGASRDLVVLLAGQDVDEDLLVRSLGVPGLDTQALATFHAVLTGIYAERPRPYHEALGRLPLADALELWTATCDDVIATLSQLDETVEAAPPPPARRAAGKPEAAAPAAQPGDAGRERLRELLVVAQARADGEELVSAIYSAIQHCPIEALRAEVSAMADDILEGMSDSVRVNRHALDGIRDAEPSQWPRWAQLLREASPGKAVAAVAANVFTDVVLKSVLVADVADLPHVVVTARALLPHVEGAAGASVGEVLTGVVTQFQWQDPPIAADDEWVARRKTALDLTSLLRDLVGSAQVDRLLAADVSTPADEVELVEDALSELLSRIDGLDVNAARLLAVDLDALAARGGASLGLLRLRLRARTRCDGAPLSPSEMSMLDDGAASTLALTDWLTLGPSGRDVAEVVPLVAPTRPSLDRWARATTADDRTTVWLALEATAATNAVLAAVGHHGVNGAVVDHMAPAVNSGTQQQMRDAAVTRLEAASLVARTGSSSPDGLRAASELALQLLESGIVGNARLARRIVAWAGRPAWGLQGKLRAAFDATVRNNGATFGKSEIRELEALGVLTKRKKRLGTGRRNR